MLVIKIKVFAFICSPTCLEILGDRNEKYIMILTIYKIKKTIFNIKKKMYTPIHDRKGKGICVTFYSLRIITYKLKLITYNLMMRRSHTKLVGKTKALVFFEAEIKGVHLGY